MNRISYLLLLLALRSSLLLAQMPTLTRDIYPGSPSSLQSSSPKSYVNANGILFFAAWDGVSGSELWRSDGTTAGTYLIKDIYSGPGDSNPSDLTYMNGIVYFRARDVSHGVELWRSDGTANGTYIVKDIYPEATDSFTAYPSLTVVNNTLYFQADHPTYGASLWRTDGTESGTVYITNGAGSTGDNNDLLGEMAEVNGKLFFVMRGTSPNAVGYELWRIDSPTSSPVVVKDINPGPANSNPGKLTRANNLLFFVATNGTQGYELWRSDGTTAGTYMTKELFSGNNDNRDFVGDLTNVNGVLFFFNLGTPETNYTQSLWRSDGSTTGTYLVKNIARGYVDTAYPCSINGLFYFVPGNIAQGQGELWRSDGTDAGTYIVKDITPDSEGAGVSNLTNVNNTLYFTATVAQSPLWRSDGTAAGTTPVFTTPSNQPNYLGNFTVATDKLFFGASTNDNGRELWVLSLTNQLVCQSLQSGNWTSSTTWSCGRVPTSFDQVIINAGHTVTVTTSTAQAKGIRYAGNGKLSLAQGVAKVYVKGE